MKNIFGYTLVELLTVLTLIAISSAFAFPQLNDFWQRTTATLLHDELEHAISFAQAAAFSRDVTTQLCPSTDLKNCSENWNNHFIVLARNQVIYVYQNDAATGNLHWRSFPRNHHRLDFSANTVLSFENGTFWYCTKPRANPIWAFAINKVARLKEIRPDPRGRIVDEKGYLLTC